MKKMTFYKKGEAIQRMNLWGKTQAPFFFLIDFDMEHCLIERIEDVSADEIRFDFSGKTNDDRLHTPYPTHFKWKSYPQSFDAYAQSFDVVYRNLYAGNSFLTNLTCATPVETDLSLLQLFEHAQAKYKLWVKDGFTVFSPEIFVRIIGGFIYSHPMKGTIDASIPNARELLLNDEKEAAEHATITDLIRNDLSQIATEVTVTRYRYLDELRTHTGRLLQMSSEIRGRLPENYREELGTLFFRLLPAGSITGAPKKKTVEIIKEAETYHRGFYTGVMGYFDGDNLDSGVLIRFLEQGEGNRMMFKSGGGITFQSDVNDEYDEMKKKVYVPIY